MANVNKVILVGTLTRDPEIKYTPKGSAVAELGLAINRHYSTDSGEKREEVTFVDVTLWGKTAELAGQYLNKGRQVYIEGRLQLDTWEDKQTGQKRSKLRVVGEAMQFIGSKPGGSSSQDDGGYHNERPQQSSRPAPPTRRPAPEQASRPQNNDFAPDEDDNIPF